MDRHCRSLACLRLLKQVASSALHRFLLNQRADDCSEAEYSQPQRRMVVSPADTYAWRITSRDADISPDTTDADRDYLILQRKARSEKCQDLPAKLIPVALAKYGPIDLKTRAFSGGHWSSLPSLSLHHQEIHRAFPQASTAPTVNVAQIDAMAVFRNEREGLAVDGQGNLYGRMKKVEKPAMLSQS